MRGIAFVGLGLVACAAEAPDSEGESGQSTETGTPAPGGSTTSTAMTPAEPGYRTVEVAAGQELRFTWGGEPRSALYVGLVRLLPETADALRAGVPWSEVADPSAAAIIVSQEDLDVPGAAPTEFTLSPEDVASDGPTWVGVFWEVDGRSSAETVAEVFLLPSPESTTTEVAL